MVPYYCTYTCSTAKETIYPSAHQEYYDLQYGTLWHSYCIGTYTEVVEKHLCSFHVEPTQQLCKRVPVWVL